MYFWAFDFVGSKLKSFLLNVLFRKKITQRKKVLRKFYAHVGFLRWVIFCVKQQFRMTASQKMHSHSA